jgi:hypothetical protein
VTNALDIVGRRYNNGVNTIGYAREDIVIGAPYLLTRDWTESQIAIARQRASHDKKFMYHAGSNWYATRLNPIVNVGDVVFGIERADTAQNLRRDRKRVVTEITDAGIMAKYDGNRPFLLTHWVKADDSTDPSKDRFNPERRKLVLDKLSAEGMSRIGDTGYATAAAEFFKKFDLPRPEVEPTAVLDLEQKFDHRTMPRDMRYAMDDIGISSLRTVTATGRAKVKLPKSECHCKDITDEQAIAAWTKKGMAWQVVKVHKVECLWCTEIARVDEVI